MRTASRVDLGRRSRDLTGELHDGGGSGCVVIGAGNILAAQLALDEQQEADCEHDGPECARPGCPAAKRSSNGATARRAMAAIDGAAEQPLQVGAERRVEEQPAARGVRVGDQAERAHGLTRGSDAPRGDVAALPLANRSETGV